MAENPHLKLTIGSTAVKGQSTQRHDDTIECYSVSFGVSNPIDWATGAASGRRQYSSINISKRIDKASPLLLKALVTNQEVKGTFKFYRPTIKGDAVTENFYTIEFEHGRVESVQQSGAGDVPMESVSFAYRKITVTITDGGVTHTDDWSGHK
jgi:type VI secretion system secreted protein Hcp